MSIVVAHALKNSPLFLEKQVGMEDDRTCTGILWHNGVLAINSSTILK